MNCGLGVNGGTMIDEEGAALLAELFNRMSHKQKLAVPKEIAARICDFMVKNGYRLVFSRWFLQEPPDETPNAKVSRDEH